MATPEDEKCEVSLTWLKSSCLLVVSLVYAVLWKEALQRAYKNIGLGDGEVFLSNIVIDVVFYVTSVCPVLAVIIEYCQSPGHKYLRLFAVFLFLLQFPIYMFYAAELYPHGCTFNKLDHATSYVGYHVKDMDIGKKINTTKYDVDCDAITFFGFAKGGREFFQLMAHAFPLFCMAAATLSFKDVVGLNINRTFLDWVDVQDFFALFTEDDVIRNYWGRDMCDDFGCTGQWGLLWRFSMGIFGLASLQVTLIASTKVFRFMNKKLNKEDVGREKAEMVYSAATGEKGDNLFQELSNFDISKLAPPFKFVLFQEASSFFFIDGPFFAIRVMCSSRYGVIASTLLVKNFLCMIMELVKLFLLLRDKNLEKLDKDKAFALLTDWVDTLVGDGIKPEELQPDVKGTYTGVDTDPLVAK